MDDIDILTNVRATSNELEAAANNIIVNYDLPFTADELIKAINAYRKHYVLNYKGSMLLIRLALTTNLRMFIAIIRALIYVSDRWVLSVNFSHLICWHENHQAIGCNIVKGYYSDVTQTYCTLYDFYEFDITDMQLPYVVKICVQAHINSKHAVYTKPATK